jgi:hypothetical protein
MVSHPSPPPPSVKKGVEEKISEIRGMKECKKLNTEKSKRRLWKV